MVVDVVEPVIEVLAGMNITDVLEEVSGGLVEVSVVVMVELVREESAGTKVTMRSKGGGTEEDAKDTGGVNDEELVSGTSEHL